MTLIYSKKSQSQLFKLNSRIQQKIVLELDKFIKGFKVDIKKIKNSKDEFRIRIGNFRVQLKKDEKDIFVTKIGKRENFYLVFL